MENNSGSEMLLPLNLVSARPLVLHGTVLDFAGSVLNFLFLGLVALARLDSLDFGGH